MLLFFCNRFKILYRYDIIPFKGCCQEEISSLRFESVFSIPPQRLRHVYKLQYKYFLMVEPRTINNDCRYRMIYAELFSPPEPWWRW